MNLDKEEIQEIKQVFNLNLYETKLWVSLLMKGVATAGQLTEHSGVPRSRTYDVLESLQKKGFVTTKIGKPLKYVATPPEEVIERMKKEVQEQSIKKIKKIEQIKNKEVYKTINKIYKKNDYSDTTKTTAIKGRYNIYSKLSKLMEQANQEVTIITNEEGLIRKTYELENIMKKLKEKNVKIRFITNKAEEQLITRITNLGLLKIVPNINMRMVIIDDDKTLLITNQEGEVPHHQEQGILIHNQYVTQGIKQLINKTLP